MTRRLAYFALALTAGVLTFVVVFQAGLGAAVILVIVCAVAPDLTMLIGFTSPSERGRLSPRAVPFYNAVHRVWGPLVLTAVYLVAVHQPALLAGALAWFTHIALDRALGFGLRDQAGFQRRGGPVLGASHLTYGCTDARLDGGVPSSHTLARSSSEGRPVKRST